MFRIIFFSSTGEPAQPHHQLARLAHPTVERQHQSLALLSLLAAAVSNSAMERGESADALRVRPSRARITYPSAPFFIQVLHDIVKPVVIPELLVQRVQLKRSARVFDGVVTLFASASLNVALE